jgi:hypothetical protein
MTYMRFVVHRRDADCGRRLGLFQAIAALAYAGRLRDYYSSHYRELLDWFNVNLDRPRSFSRSSKAHAAPLALSWFKQSALVHIAKMREIVVILEEHGIGTEVLFCKRPGYVVYDDEFQTVAEPYAETRT